jgi:hypothetical protein
MVTNNRIWNDQVVAGECEGQGCTGIWVGAYTGECEDACPIAVTALNNKITANKIDGFEFGVVTDGDEGTKEHGNQFPFKPFE